MVLHHNRRAVHAVRSLTSTLMSVAARHREHDLVSPGAPANLPFTANLSAPAVVSVMQDTRLPVQLRSIFCQWWLALYRHRVSEHLFFAHRRVSATDDPVTKLLQPCWSSGNQQYCARAHPKCLLAYVLEEMRGRWDAGGWSTDATGQTPHRDSDDDDDAATVRRRGCARDAEAELTVVCVGDVRCRRTGCM